MVRNLPRNGYVDVDASRCRPITCWTSRRYFDSTLCAFPTVDRRAIQIFTSRGCPYRCTYCHDLFGKKFRGRKPELVWDEIKFLHDTYGVREFMIEDDIFNMDLERAKRICDLVIQSGLRLGLPVRQRRPAGTLRRGADGEAGSRRHSSHGDRHRVGQRSDPEGDQETSETRAVQ